MEQYSLCMKKKCQTVYKIRNKEYDVIVHSFTEREEKDLYASERERRH
jgi:hypothetical protein